MSNITNQLKEQYDIGFQYYEYIMSIVNKMTIDKAFSNKSPDQYGLIHFKLSDIIANIVGKISYKDYTNEMLSNISISFYNNDYKICRISLDQYLHYIDPNRNNNCPFSQTIRFREFYIKIKNSGEYDIHPYAVERVSLDQSNKTYEIKCLKDDGLLPNSIWDFIDEHWVLIKLST